jgi:hypothetical protein
VSCLAADQKTAKGTFVADSEAAVVVFAAEEFTGGEGR